MLATTLGTLAALGLARSACPTRALIMGVLISPMIVPLVITAVGMYFFYSPLGLAQPLPGLILAHTALGTPFVVITVTATLSGFDYSLVRAAPEPRRLARADLLQGADAADPAGRDLGRAVRLHHSVRRGGGRAVPRPAPSSAPSRARCGPASASRSRPTILAVATVLIVISILLLTTIELLRRRNERLRGIRA